MDEIQSSEGDDAVGNESSSTSAEGKIIQPDQTQYENMEVHHHPDLRHRKKHWKEYFLEFLMIFLAVTLGFLAENLREHISEKDRAAVFAKSLTEDFKADTTTLHQLTEFTTSKIKNIDSIDVCIHAVRNRKNDSALYVSVLFLISTSQFDNINGTYEQIKNSGALRFFNQDLVNNLNSYDATSLKLKLMEDWENKFLFEKVAPQTQIMFNFRVFRDLPNGGAVKHDMYLKNMNEESVDLLLNQAETIRRLRVRQLGKQIALLNQANIILKELEKER